MLTVPEIGYELGRVPRQPAQWLYLAVELLRTNTPDARYSFEQWIAFRRDLEKLVKIFQIQYDADDAATAEVGRRLRNLIDAHAWMPGSEA